MNNINTVYSFFYTKDYTGGFSVSSYALPFTPLTFIPRLNDVENFLSNKKIVWDFGDGTTTTAVTATHFYNDAGKYKVTCYLYDKNGEGYYDSFSQNVIIKNYLTDNISLSTNNTTSYILTAGKFLNPIIFTNAISWQALDSPADNKSVTVYISGSNSYDYFRDNIATTHYGHLYPYSSVYLLLTGLNNLTEFVEVSSFETISTPIYIKLSGTTIVTTDKYDTDSFFCGIIGTRDLYYKDDKPNTVNVMLGYEPGELRPFSNTSTVGYTVSVVSNTDYDHLSITSNGIDEEGTTDTTFNINKNKFSYTKIGFVVKIKDSENFTIKNAPLIDNGITLTLTNGTTTYSSILIDSTLITESFFNLLTEESTSIALESTFGEYDVYFFSNFGKLSSLDSGGFFKGYMISNLNTLAENVFISAGYVVGSKFISGTSSTFNLYPSGGTYNIAKRGEDFDFKKTFKSVALQPLFVDDKVLIDDFIGSIFGDLSAAQTSIGKTTYEKIKNFVDNNAILDYSNVNQLISILKSLNLDDIKFTSYNLNYPAEIGRLINLLSIKHSKLFGSQNVFNEDFLSYGYLNSNFYAKNLGNEVSINYTVTAGQDLISFEKFSGKYRRLNSYNPLSSSNISISANNTYNLIDYNNSWGWGLILPDNGYGSSIENYYLFYEYTPNINGTITDSVINFTDPNTTLSYTTSSYSDWSEQNGIISNIISKELYKGLDLFVP